MTEPSDTALFCRGLVKRFGDVTAVDGLDLEVLRGECFGLLGPNGAGKTTTIEILEGLTEADAGEVEVLGMRWGEGDDTALRQRLGVQLQETQLADKLTVEEIIRLFRSFYDRGRTVEQVIELLGFESKRKARYHQLSGGQRQRLALACALVSDPEVLFLDEPTTGLDPQARFNLWELIEQYRDGGGTVVLTTHYMEEAARLCDRLAIIDRGRVVALGSPAELIQSLGADQILEFEATGHLERGDLEALPGVRSVLERADQVVLTVAEVRHALPALLGALQARQLELKSVATHQATLDDVFLQITGRALRDE